MKKSEKRIGRRRKELRSQDEDEREERKEEEGRRKELILQDEEREEEEEEGRIKITSLRRMRGGRERGGDEEKGNITITRWRRLKGNEREGIFTQANSFPEMLCCETDSRNRCYRDHYNYNLFNSSVSLYLSYISS